LVPPTGGETKAKGNTTMMSTLFGPWCPRLSMVVMLIAFLVGLSLGGIWMIVLPLGMRFGGFLTLAGFLAAATNPHYAWAIPYLVAYCVFSIFVGANRVAIRQALGLPPGR
jgi:hypothetical protein